MDKENIYERDFNDMKNLFDQIIIMIKTSQFIITTSINPVVAYSSNQKTITLLQFLSKLQITTKGSKRIEYKNCLINYYLKSWLVNTI